ncbi:MAG: PorT family protein [Cyclobacteriaceae bacterium]|nr:PorT family protein [Cyclobacteriaceae bacterium]
MHIINIWYQFNLRRRKIAVLFVIIFGMCMSPSFAQLRKPNMNNPEYDNHLISYGFLIGLHTSGYKIKYADAFDNIDSLHSIQPQSSLGFSLGFIVNLRLTQFLDLRLLPKVAFYEHTLDYIRTNDPILTETVESTVVELPLIMKYKSVRWGNIGMYIVGGGKFGIEASGKNKDNQKNSEGLFVQGSNLSVDFGFGFDLYYPLFKFSPELRFSRGLSNMLLSSKSNDLSLGIKSLNVNTITLYLLFQ